MPSGAKKRKALKRKKQQQEAIGGASTTNNKGFNGDNLHGNDEHGSQDGRGSDSSLSSPGSQGNEEFGDKDSPAALSSGMVKGAATETSGDADVVTQGLGSKSGNAVAVERGTDYQKSIVEKSSNSTSDNRTHPAKHVACGTSVTEITPVLESVKPVVAPLSKAVTSGEKSEHVETSNLVKKKSEKSAEYHPSPGLENNNNKVAAHPAKHVASGNSVTEITPVVESVKPMVVPLSKAVTSEKSEHVDETSTHSSLVGKKSEKNEEYHPSPGLENNINKVAVTLPRSAAETSKKVESVRNSEAPVSSEEKCVLLPGPPAVRRTSWLSCCGLFDAMTGSDR